MAFQSWISNYSYEPACYSKLDQFSSSLGVFDGASKGGSPPDSEVVQASECGGRKRSLSEAKAMAALKNHSEAERRRRGRINSHLDALRDLVPCTDKMDKAALLAQVVNQVKDLKKISTEASKGFLIPTDTDEVKVELETKDGNFTYIASLCCDYRPDLISDLKQALDDLRLITIKAEISTLGDRVKTVFVFTSYKEGKSVIDHDAHCVVVDLIRQALNSVLDKVSTSLEYSPRTSVMNKRRRLSFFDSSTSSWL